MVPYDNYVSTAYQRPIIFLIDLENQIKWRLYLECLPFTDYYMENIVSLKFNPTGTFILAILEKAPLTLLFFRVSDGFYLGG
jgi:hypothetical protein